MQISTLVVERNDRVGDTWRRRYPTLMLHTPKEHHTCTSCGYLTGIGGYTFPNIFSALSAIPR